MKIKDHKKAWLSKFIWSLIGLINITLFIFSFLPIPGLATLHGYTIGLAFGLFAPLFYIFFGLLCLQKIFNFKKISWFFFHPSSFKIAMLVIGIVFLTVAIIYISNNLDYDTLDSDHWVKTFKQWWKDFSEVDGEAKSLFPQSYQHLGLVIVFVTALIAWLTTIWTVLIIAILIIIFELYLIFAPQKWIPKWLSHDFWTKVLVKIFLFFDHESKVKIKRERKDFKYQFDVNKKPHSKQVHDDSEYDLETADFSGDTFNEEIGGAVDDMYYEDLGIIEDPLKASEDFMKTYNRNRKKDGEIKEEEIPFDDPF